MERSLASSCRRDQVIVFDSDKIVCTICLFLTSEMDCVEITG